MEKLLFEGGAEDIRATDKAQAAITLVNLAAAGFSLGEYAALVTARVMDEEAVFSLVKFRGEVMETASRALDAPEGPPGMSAVMGLICPRLRGRWRPPAPGTYTRRIITAPCRRLYPARSRPCQRRKLF
jgi:malonyl CoA-acyl carrier protein transacylase